MRSRIWVAISLSACILLAPAARGFSKESAPAAPAEGTGPLPGIRLAETLATVTGIAITPLLGVSVVGAWQYYHADESVRPTLPWYTARWFWVPALIVGLLLALKDPILGVIPGAKKPLDALDVLENKASAIVAAPAVVPMFLSAFAVTRATGRAADAGGLGVSQAGLAPLPGFLEDLPSAIGLALGGLGFLAAFFCVWLAFHAINVLILLSPFGVLDTLLRAIKLLVLVVLVGGTFLHPYLGLLVALVILAAAIPLAGWSFRLMVFGGVLAADLVTRRHRHEAATASVRAFTVGQLGSARARTYGVVSAGESGVSFTYRPWLVLPRRRVELPPGSYRVGRAILCPILRLTPEGQEPVAVLRLPPRYRGHEERLVSVLLLAGVDDLPLLRGIRAIWTWLKETAGRGSREAARLAGQVREELLS